VLPPVSGDEITVASLYPRETAAQTNVERLLLTANRQPDVVKGIVIDPELLKAVGRAPIQFNPFTSDISLPLNQFALLAQQADGGTHPIADAATARGVLDAAARCADVGIYTGNSTGRSPGASEDDLLVHTQLFVRPPLGLSSVSIGFSPKATGSPGPTNSATTSFSYSTIEPLDATVPGINESTSTDSLDGTFSHFAFTGSATYRETLTIPVSTLQVKASALHEALAIQHFVGQGQGIEMNVWVYSNDAISGVLINQNLTAGSHTTDPLPVTVQIGGQIQDNSAIQMIPSGTYAFLAAIRPTPYSMNFTVVAGRADSPQSLVSLTGCTR
jgi:hypothetical protein